MIDLMMKHKGTFSFSLSFIELLYCQFLFVLRYTVHHMNYIVLILQFGDNPSEFTNCSYT